MTCLVPELIASQTIQPLLCVPILSLYLYVWQSRKSKFWLVGGEGATVTVILLLG